MNVCYFIGIHQPGAASLKSIAEQISFNLTIILA